MIDASENGSIEKIRTFVVLKSLDVMSTKQQNERQNTSARQYVEVM